MMTECSQLAFDFHPLGSRQVTVAFTGGTITSDGGAQLPRESEFRTGLLASLADYFDDYRDLELVEHTVEELVKQRVFTLVLGYEDLNDHDTLRLDPLLATVVGKADPTGANRLRAADRGKPLAGKSTLNRLELTPANASAAERYKKIAARPEAIDRLFVDVFLQAHAQPPARIVLDLDATDDPLHGHQEGRFFHGYYKQFCYLPLYIFCGDHLLCAKLRPSHIDASAGALKEIQRIVERLRQLIAERAHRRLPRFNVSARAADWLLRLPGVERLVDEGETLELVGELNRVVGEPQRAGRPAPDAAVAAPRAG